MTQDQTPAPLVCEECGAETDHLYGWVLEAPKLCETCYEKAVQEEKRAGRVCGLCGTVRKNCMC
jgi:hypothetical protein